MLTRYPLPPLKFELPPVMEEIRQKLIIQRDVKKEQVEPLKVAVYGYNSYARAIIESLRDDPLIRVHLITKSIIER